MFVRSSTQIASAPSRSTRAGERAEAPFPGDAVRRTDTSPRFLQNVLGLCVPLGCLAACGGSLAPASDLEGGICGDDAGDARARDAGAADRAAPPPTDGPDATATPDATGTTDAASWDGSGPDATTTPDGGPPDAAPTPDGSSADTCAPCAGTCFGSRCLVVLATNQVGPSAIAVNSSAVYWMNAGDPTTSYGESAVMTIGKMGGGAPTMIQATPGTELHSIVADDRSVVWVATGSTEGGTIWSSPVTAPSSPVSLASGAVTLTMDATAVYFGSEKPQGQDGSFESTVWRVDRNGGAPTALTSGTGEAMAILTYTGTVYEEAYPDSLGGASIYAVGTDGSNPRTFATGLPGLLSLAAQGADLYLGQELDFSAIDELPLSGENDGGLPVFLENYSATALTSDGTNLYFTYQNAVYSLATDAGAPVPLAWKLRAPYAIAVDDESVYWADEICGDDGGCTGAVLKLSPK